MENLLERLTVGFNEVVDIHRETVKAQKDRVGNLERRTDRLEGKSWLIGQVGIVLSPVPSFGGIYHFQATPSFAKEQVLAGRTDRW